MYWPGKPQLRTERSGTGTLLLSNSLRLGFLGHLSYTPEVWLLSNRFRTGLRPIPVCPGIQKTFSAGPCSFKAKELWFPGRVEAPEVQPVIDSRRGRIACKIQNVSIITAIKCQQESRRLQSNSRAQCPTPKMVNGGSHKFRFVSMMCQTFVEDRRRFV